MTSAPHWFCIAEGYLCNPCWRWNFRELRIEFRCSQCGKIEGSRSFITMASTNLTIHTREHCYVTLSQKFQLITVQAPLILFSRRADMLLDHDFLRLHEVLVILFGGENESSTFKLTTACIDSPPVFQYFTLLHSCCCHISRTFHHRRAFNQNGNQQATKRTNN